MLNNRVVKKKVILTKSLVKKLIPLKKIQVKKEIVKPAISGKIERIEIKSVQDILKIVGNKDYFEIYNLISVLDKDFFTRGFVGSFESKKEVNSFFEERIFDFLKGIYSDLKSKISQLRKKGNLVTYIDYEVLSIPLKMKILESDFNLGNFLKIKSLIDFALKELSNFKIED
jgi:hypothetical protein